MRYFILFNLLIAGNIATAQSAVVSDTTWEKYQGNHFEISYPSTWKTDTSRLMGTELFIFSPLENEEDHFSENINIYIQDLKGMQIDLQKYLEMSEKQIHEYATEGEIYTSSIVKNKNPEYCVISYKMRQGKLMLRITSRCIIKNEKAYLITFSSDINEHEKYETVSARLLDNFMVY